MDNKCFEDLCYEQIRRFYAKERHEECPDEDIFKVWLCKTIQNFKGIFATNHKDHLLFEITYNGDKRELYVDCYDKVKKITCMV